MRKLPGLSYIKSTAHSSNTKHREHTVRQLKYSEYTAIAPPILQQYSCVHHASITQPCTHQASQIHSESAQILRVYSDITKVLLPAPHIVITQPCTPSISGNPKR